jgi:hypothetical protein
VLCVYLDIQPSSANFKQQCKCRDLRSEERPIGLEQSFTLVRVCLFTASKPETRGFRAFGSRGHKTTKDPLRRSKSDSLMAPCQLAVLSAARGMRRIS